jgi:UDP-N-acetylglucosamine 2-epimerase (non-hydrolysing)
MPEEINRLATDAVSDDLFTTDRFAEANLRREGVAESRVHLIGNVMIDSLMAHLPEARALRHHERLGLAPQTYATMTLHRPANVESRDKLAEILDAILDSVGDLPVVFPCHPRTRKRVADFGLSGRFVDVPGRRGIWMTEPLGYLEFMALNSQARIVLTDSGGLQEETTILGVPCVTIRDNTERPVTIEDGSNILAGTSGSGIRSATAQMLARPAGAHRTPPLWDGKAAERIVARIESLLGA